MANPRVPRTGVTSSEQHFTKWEQLAPTAASAAAAAQQKQHCLLSTALNTNLQMAKS